MQLPGAEWVCGHSFSVAFEGCTTAPPCGQADSNPTSQVNHISQMLIHRPASHQPLTAVLNQMQTHTYTQTHTHKHTPYYKQNTKTPQSDIYWTNNNGDCDIQKYNFCDKPEIYIYQIFHMGDSKKHIISVILEH